MFYELFRLAVNNALRARGRLLITSSGMVIGTTAVILLVGLTLGLQQSAEAGVGGDDSLTQMWLYPGFVVDSGGERLNITAERLAAIEQMPQIAAAVPIVQLTGSAVLETTRYQQNAPAVGIQPEHIAALGIEAVNGDITQFSEGSALLGVNIPGRFRDLRSPQPVPITLDVLEERINLLLHSNDGRIESSNSISIAAVIGSEDGRYDNQIILPLQVVQTFNASVAGEVFDPAQAVYERVFIRTSSRQGTIEATEQFIDAGYAVESLGEFLRDLDNFFSLMRLVLGAVGGMALLIAAFSVANTMMVATLERANEIGLMKAIGARDRDVLLVFLFEAGLVGLFGGIAGSALAIILADAINEWIATAPAFSGGQLSFLFDPTQLQNDLILLPDALLGFAVIIATCVGLLAGFLPAWRVSQMSPVIALKRE